MSKSNNREKKNWVAILFSNKLFKKSKLNIKEAVIKENLLGRDF